MAHAAPTVPRRHRHMATAGTKHVSTTAYTVPLLLGLVYGVWAAFLEREQGPVDAANVFYGILCGVLFAAGVFALHRYGRRMMRELHATAWGAFIAIAFGYLYSLPGASVLSSVCMGLAIGAGAGLMAFYRYYTTEP